MSVCPLCNGLTTINYTCEQCSKVLNDNGKIIDYFDDYSAYLDTDGMKKIDGYPNDLQQHQCPHLFYCDDCHKEAIVFIQEV
ncbi:hypothetical protein ACJ2A9_07155 [Anaerobacillus sp. MEB173]|uniref:hypothetical protein n=1 Tax=Anaerobacillus sp. MEB173 TaxID=3383345 RepID=UPI003F8ED590